MTDRQAIAMILAILYAKSEMETCAELMAMAKEIWLNANKVFLEVSK